MKEEIWKHFGCKISRPVSGSYRLVLSYLKGNMLWIKLEDAVSKLWWSHLTPFSLWLTKSFSYLIVFAFLCEILKKTNDEMAWDSL